MSFTTVHVHVQVLLIFFFFNLIGPSRGPRRWTYRPTGHCPNARMTSPPLIIPYTSKCSITEAFVCLPDISTLQTLMTTRETTRKSRHLLKYPYALYRGQGLLKTCQVRQVKVYLSIFTSIFLHSVFVFCSNALCERDKQILFTKQWFKRVENDNRMEKKLQG